MAISKEKLDGLKQVLLEEKKRIEENIEILGADLEFGDSPGLDNEEADEGEEAANNLSAVTLLKDRVANIDTALTKMESGTYGICEHCGEEIELELLEANPESRVCRECKG